MDTAVDLVQGTDAWHQARLGKATASRVADIIAKTKTGWGASRRNYLAELVAERLTGQPAESYTNAAMRHGVEVEPHARAAYVFFHDQEVGEVGFVNHPSISMAGASPDGLVGEHGLIEIKCPNTATHIDTLLREKIDGKYITQVQFQLACTGRKWCDWISFDPRLPENMRMFVARIERDDERIEKLEEEVTEFLDEVDAVIEALKETTDGV